MDYNINRMIQMQMSVSQKNLCFRDVGRKVFITLLKPFNAKNYYIFEQYFP